jgi:predicted HicB family RNase H-like nuclease
MGPIPDIARLIAQCTMATMTIRIPDRKHERLKLLAETQGVSLNKLPE